MTCPNFFFLKLDNGFDVFSGVPNDDELAKQYSLSDSVVPLSVSTASSNSKGSVIEIHYCDKPLLPFYQISHSTPQFYSLRELLQTLQITEQQLRERLPDLIIRTISREDFRRAQLINVDTRSRRIDEPEIVIVERSPTVDRLLGFFTLIL